MSDNRSMGERRWGLDAEFPLKDCDGLMIVANRRQIKDRRLENTSLEDRLMMFSGMPHLGSNQ